MFLLSLYVFLSANASMRCFSVNTNIVQGITQYIEPKEFLSLFNELSENADQGFEFNKAHY